MIASTSNPQVRNLLQLQKKARVRNGQDVFLAEGLKMFLEAPKARIHKVYLSKSLYEEKGAGFLRDLPAEIMEDRVFAAVSDTKTPQGILCVLRQFHYRLEDLLTKKHPLLLLLEDLQDPVLLSKNCVDLYNPKTIRSTMGSIYRMPFVCVERLEDTLPFLKERGIRTYAAHLQGKNCYDEEDYRRGSAFLIGNEGNGLSRELSDQADALIRIPMHGQLESLNAAVAASILMYEACRQRR